MHNVIINGLYKFQDTCNHQVSIMCSKLENNQIFAFQGCFIIIIIIILI